MLPAMLNDDALNVSRRGVQLFMHRDFVQNIFEFDDPLDLRKNRRVVRIPIDEKLTLGDLSSIGDLQVTAVRHRMALKLSARGVLNSHLAVTTKDHVGVVLELDRLDPVVLDETGVLRFDG